MNPREESAAVAERGGHILTELERVGVLGKGVGGETNFVAHENTAIMVGRLYTEFTPKGGVKQPMKLESERVITNVFAELLVDAMQAITAPAAYMQNIKYHSSGTGGGAEAVGDAFATLTNAHGIIVGNQGEASSKVYQSVATLTYTGSFTPQTEHIIMAEADGGSAVDRSLISSQAVGNGDTITFTYTLTVASGG